MERLGVHLELVRIGEFKGAMEPFIMTEQSPDVRANKNQLLDDVFGRVVAAIAQDRTRAGRPIDVSVVRALIDRGHLHARGTRRWRGWPTRSRPKAISSRSSQRAFGRPSLKLRDPDRSPHAARRLAQPARGGAVRRRHDRRRAERRPAVRARRSSPASDTLVAALEQCRHDPTIARGGPAGEQPGRLGLRLRRRGPRGQELRAAGKPIVVSMGDLAASGGYYIAAPADVIYAEPSTLSGSIGVFGYKVDAQKLLGTLGINVETYRRGAHADFLSPYRPWTEEERAHRRAADPPPLPAVRRHRRRGARAAAASPPRASTSSGGGTSGPARWRRGWAWSTGWAGLGAAIDEAAHLGGVPLGRDRLPELTLLPAEDHGLLRRLTGASVLADDANAESESEDNEPAAVAPTVTPSLASLLTGDARAALRLLAPFLVQGSGTGYAARLPYDIDLR